MGHVRVARTARCAAPWRRQRAPRPSTAAAASSSTAAAAPSVADLLVQQRDRDLQGHGVSLRPVAEEGWQAEYTSRYSSTKLSRSCTQLLISFDRLLSDERRCAAYVAAIDSALASGARTFAVLGAGSLLPALHAARAGAKVAIIEPCEPLAGVARAAASSNGVTIAVLAKAELLRRAWGGPPDAIISERVDEGLLAEGIVGSLRSAVRAFGGAPRHVLPRAASVCAVAVQLGFDGVDGFGLDGLGIDLRQFDSLRPSGAMALQHPGYWPVRLVPARQPHRRLSRPFAATRVQFDEVCANACSSGGAGGAYGGMAGAAAGSGATLSVSVVESGLLNAIVYWFDLEVGEGADARVSSAPPESGNRHGAAGGWSEGWRQAAGYLTTPRYVTAGETLTIAAHMDLESGLRFELLAVTPKATPKADGAFGGTSPYEDGHGAAARAVSMVVGGLVSGLVDGGKLNRGASLPITAYHFCMVADTVRNDAYRAAIERAVRRRPGCRVLDIGAGTGLLGLIASRAGASAVDCVEMNDVLARVASGTLQASGVTAANVWHTISTDLPLDPTGKAGPTGRADVIVSEVLDSGLLGEGVLHTMRDATRRLLAPGGCLVPRAARLCVMAVEVLYPEVSTRSGDFRFDCLEAMRRPMLYASARLHTIGHTKLSKPAEAFHFDFYSPRPLGTDGKPLDREVRLTLPALRRGRCNAIAWWFDLELDEETTLSVAPGSAVRTWKQNLSFLLEPLTVARGDAIEALVWTSGDDQVSATAGKPGVQRPADYGKGGALERTST